MQSFQYSISLSQLEVHLCGLAARQFRLAGGFRGVRSGGPLATLAESKFARVVKGVDLRATACNCPWIRARQLARRFRHGRQRPTICAMDAQKEATSFSVPNACDQGSPFAMLRLGLTSPRIVLLMLFSPRRNSRAWFISSKAPHRGLLGAIHTRNIDSANYREIMELRNREQSNGEEPA